MVRWGLPVVAAVACCPQPDAPLREGAGRSTVALTSAIDTTAYLAFGSNSVVLPHDIKDVCDATGTLTASCQLTANVAVPLPINGRYLNATVAFGSPPGCGSTKAELNVNNPNWFDVLDVSLVDGYSNRLSITADTTVLEPAGETGNEAALGVFPYGCDICVERQDPPCGIAKGKTGCKSGSQYDPDVPCQWQGPVRGGGSAVTVALVE